MGLEPQFTRADIKKFIEKKLKGINRAIELRLKRTGEEFITLARSNGEYTDRTGNLRAAPFYMVLYNGLVLAEDYGDGEGAAKSQALADKLSDGYSSGWALICGDGMEYAAAVESRGKDVITGSTQQIEITLKAALNRIRNKIDG